MCSKTGIVELILFSIFAYDLDIGAEFTHSKFVNDAKLK